MFFYSFIKNEITGRDFHSKNVNIYSRETFLFSLILTLCYDKSAYQFKSLKKERILLLLLRILEFLPDLLLELLGLLVYTKTSCC